MHYCDYNWTGGGPSMAVCRQACASDLVGKTNNPYRWEWPSSSALAPVPYVTCTGQPGCTPRAAANFVCGFIQASLSLDGVMPMTWFL